MVKSLLFQSLLGFKINWNILQKFIPMPRQEFQSLLGFKINWNGGSLHLF